MLAPHQIIEPDQKVSSRIASTMNPDKSYRTVPKREGAVFLLSPKTLAIFLAAIAVLLVSIKVLGQMTSYSELREPRFAWLVAADQLKLVIRYQTLLLAICAILALRISLKEHKINNPFVFQWALMAFIFTALGIAKVTALLQQAMGLVRSVDERIGLPLTMPAIAIALLAVLALPYWKFLKKLQPQLRKSLIAGGIVYFGGGVLMEALSEFMWNLGGSESLPYIAVSAIEELLEMGGCIIVAAALLSHIQIGHQEPSSMQSQQGTPHN